ncbi:MAG TPA: family 16 glycoside hydrolase [Tepidisphaeraceae bacterium]|jgi:clan AA aspartic protease (TIGR02281 family)
MMGKSDWVVCAVACWLLVWGGQSVAQQAPEEVLKSKGLTKVGQAYLLDGDVKLPDDLRKLLHAKKLADDDAAKRAALQKDIAATRSSIADMEAQYRDLNQQLQKKRKNDVYHRNQLGSQSNVVASNLRDAQRYLDERQAELSRMTGEPHETYAGVVLDLGERMDATAKRYEALAADAEVTGAIARLNTGAGPNFKLGPSSQFTRELVFVRNQRGLVNTGVVKFTMERGVPQVTATLNGSVTMPKIFDSGAAMVSLNADVARQLGMAAGANDPVIKLVAANGAVTEARVMTLKSLRVGQFTVTDVPCAIKPMKGTDCLLGGTFLRNFVYRMDLGAGEIHMTQIGGKGQAAEDKAAAASGAPASTQPPTAPAAGPDGFVPLFNGKDLTGWVYATKDNGSPAKDGQGYQVKDGVLYCTKGDGGRLCTTREFGDFILRFDFKLTESANNGIGIRMPLRGDPAYVAMEIQIQDDTGKQYQRKDGRSKLRPNQYHGSIYDVVPAKQGSLKPVGQWNSQEIKAEGRHVTVRLNGMQILDADLDQVTDDAVLKKHPGLTNIKGHIGLLGHESAVEFRNVRIREL